MDDLEVRDMKRQMAAEICYRFRLRAVSIVHNIPYADTEALLPFMSETSGESEHGVDAWSVAFNYGDYTGEVFSKLRANSAALARQTIPDRIICDGAVPTITMRDKMIVVEYPWPKSLLIMNERVQLVHPVRFNQLQLGIRAAVPIGVSHNGTTVNIYFGDSRVDEDGHAVNHLLVAGTTGSGKTTALLALVTALAIQKKSLLVLLDGKGGRHGLKLVEDYGRVRDGEYSGVVSSVATEPDDILNAIKTVKMAMEARYAERFDGLPHAARFLAESKKDIIVIFDEFSEPFDYNPDIANAIKRILEKGRQARVFMILATQNPSKATFGDVDMRRLLNGKMVFHVDDSTVASMVLGSRVDDAPAHLLPMPGAAYFAVPGLTLRITAPHITAEEIEMYMQAYGRGSMPFPIETWETLEEREDDLSLDLPPQEAAAAIAAAHYQWGRPRTQSARGGPSLSDSRYRRLKAWGSEVLGALRELDVCMDTCVHKEPKM